MFADGNESRALNRVDRRQPVAERRRLDWPWGEEELQGRREEGCGQGWGKNRRKEERVSLDNRGYKTRMITRKEER